MDNSERSTFLREAGLTRPYKVGVRLKHENDYTWTAFDQPFLVVGRREESDLFLDHWQVSRRHAYLQIVDGQVCCVDLGSRTGTHGGVASDRTGWIETSRPIQIGPFWVMIDLPELGPTRPDYPSVIWDVPDRRNGPTRWVMSKGMSLIGRAPSCQVRLVSSEVAKFHASVVLTHTGVWVLDLLSQRQILVNDEPVRLRRLRSGDVVKIGSHYMIPHFEMAPEAHAAGDPSTGEEAIEDFDSGSHNLLPAVVEAPTWTPSTWSPADQGLIVNGSQGYHLPADPNVAFMMQQFGQMQQQMFDQFHQTMMMMFDHFVSLHRDTTDTLRGEFDEVRKLSREIDELRSETSRLADATSQTLQHSVMRRSDEVRRPPTPNGSIRFDEGQPIASKVQPPLPDNQSEIHAQLCHRLKLIETERQTRWQKILAMMTTKN